LSRIVHVAVGVIVGKDGRILIAKRPEQAHQGGLWEFPGGKVEHQETLAAALKRELYEELAIRVVATEPLIQIRHDYGDKTVLLDVLKVTDFTGVPCGNEGQPIAWVEPQELHHYPFPAANRPIVTAIQLPSRFLITGEFSSLDDLVVRTESALQNGLRLVQLRLSAFNLLEQAAAAISELCQRYNAQLLINTSPELFAALQQKNIRAGLHLNASNLLACACRPVDVLTLLSASCHNETEIQHAQKIGVDFVCLSPVQKTRSHLEQAAMGWQEFARLVDRAVIPVFALGGLTDTDLSQAVENGAQGIASISAWWPAN